MLLKRLWFSILIGSQLPWPVYCESSSSASSSPSFTAAASSPSSSIPRSAQRSSNVNYYRFPPWNPSPLIDDDGFILQTYQRIPGDWEREPKLKLPKSLHADFQQVPVKIRQVPGDGNCLFHSISTCYAYAVNGTHLDLRSVESMQWLYQHSAKLRQQAVDCLLQRRKILFLQGQEYIRAHDMVEGAASQYGISSVEYCHFMRQDSYWGGGPEIVALCNVLQRPIHVYELHVCNNQFVLRRMACFGSPKFDKQPALHILSADSRFPDLIPGKQLASGNHFLAMFPEEAHKQQRKKSHSSNKKPKLRGGESPAFSPPSRLCPPHHARASVPSLHKKRKPTAFLPKMPWWKRLLLPGSDDSRK